MKVIYEVDDQVAVVTINRPAVRNALDTEVLEGLRGAFHRFVSADAERVLVLTGAGTDAFSAGADLEEMAAGAPPDPAAFPIPGDTIDVPKVVIAAVEGVAYGGGLLLVQGCDLCVASSDARFAVPEARWGRGAPYAGILARLIPPRVAMQLVVTAQPIDAETALHAGLVNEVVEPGHARDAAMHTAKVIAAHAPRSVVAGKRLIDRTVVADRAELMAAGRAAFADVYEDSEALEGARAFRDRREPDW